MRGGDLKNNKHIQNRIRLQDLGQEDINQRSSINITRKKNPSLSTFNQVPVKLSSKATGQATGFR